jgi:rubrerythrin
VANLLSRKIPSFDAVTMRNGDVVYDDGVPKSEIAKVKKKKVRGATEGSEEFGVCIICNMKVEIPSSNYCPNCGEILKTGPIVVAFSWKRRKSQ